jgi:tetratricopeptide (TPR) repeat protein
MTHDPDSAGRGQHTRPRVLPPLPLWSNGVDVMLEEIPDERLALELWIQLRHLRDWLAFPAGSRPDGLFPPCPSERVLTRRAEAISSLPDALRQALRTFHALTDGIVHPDEVIVRGCLDVADWALNAGHTATAVQFTTPAARVASFDPTCLNAAGLAHRRAGEWEAAALYYERAAHCANTQKNADEHASAHIGLAALWSSRGRYRRARRHLSRATNIAQRSGSAWLGAHVQHDLMLMLTERQQYPEAEAAAMRAVSLYPLHDSRFPFFAADFAFLQIAQGYYSEAVPALEQFLGLIRSPAQQVIGLSLLARTYAGAGRVVEYSQVRDNVVQLIRVYTADAGAALFHLAEASRSLGEWAEAAAYAELSRQAALDSGDKAVARFAARLYNMIRERRSPPGPITRASGEKAPAATTLAVRLRGWNAQSRRGRKRRPRRNHWGHF